MEDIRPFGMEDYHVSRTDEVKGNPLDKEVGGNHYKSRYQPIELMEKVRMYATCSYILKYVFRHKNKGKKQDLEKALHCCELMNQLGCNWYAGTPINMDYSRYEFYKFITENKQLDANQIRAILAIANKDMDSLKESISEEIICCYGKVL